MKPKPKIKPRLMWACVNKRGDIMLVGDKIEIEQAAYPNETVHRVLVCEPPKRRKRHVK